MASTLPFEEKWGQTEFKERAFSYELPYDIETRKRYDIVEETVCFDGPEYRKRE